MATATSTGTQSSMQPSTSATVAAMLSSAGAAQTSTDAHAGNGSGDHGGSGSESGTTASSSPTVDSTSSADAGQTAQTFALGATTGAQSSTAGAAQGIVTTSVHLQDAVDAVKASFTAANAAGVASARITLSPASLGGIRISLTQTADGIVARVATDHPEAAQTLQQSAGDLKRSLEASGMSLLRLDIGSTGQQSMAGFSGSSQSQGDSPASGSSAGAAEGTDLSEDETTSTTGSTLGATSGALVDVLA